MAASWAATARAPHVDLDGNPCDYDALLAKAPADALERIAPRILAQRHAEVQAAIARLAGDIAAAKLDALIVVGDDQEELFDQSQHAGDRHLLRRDDPQCRSGLDRRRRLDGTGAPALPGTGGAGGTCRATRCWRGT